MSGQIVDDSVFIPIKALNPFEGVQYPARGWALAVLDTGYTGFLLLPPEIYEFLRLGEQRQKIIKAETADGREVTLRAAYATVRVRDLDAPIDGLVETGENVGEVLSGMRALRHLQTIIDTCTGAATLTACT